MAIYYEWTCERVDDIGDIVESNFSERLADFIEDVRRVRRGDTEYQIALVVNDSRGRRTWAYLYRENGSVILPEVSEDSYGRPGRKVPKRFHAELEKVQKNLLS